MLSHDVCLPIAIGIASVRLPVNDQTHHSCQAAMIFCTANIINLSTTHKKSHMCMTTSFRVTAKDTEHKRVKNVHDFNVIMK